MLVAGLLLLWLSSILLRGYVRADPATLARVGRQGVGSLALVVAVLMIVRGEFNVAVLAAGFGLWLLGTQASFPGRPLSRGLGGFARRSRTRASGSVRVRTAVADVVVDRLSGVKRGRFTTGPWAGRDFDNLSESECAVAGRWCQSADPEGARLFEAYLDRRFAGWREAAEFGGDLGGAQAQSRMRRTAGMPDHEAYDVLGLAEGASREEIARAHRRLMKQYHPDHGGSTAMAARVNEAKDVLMRRHP